MADQSAIRVFLDQVKETDDQTDVFDFLNTELKAQTDLTLKQQSHVKSFLSEESKAQTQELQMAEQATRDDQD